MFGWIMFVAIILALGVGWWLGYHKAGPRVEHWWKTRTERKGDTGSD